MANEREIKFRAFHEVSGMHNDFRFIKSGDEANDWIVFTSDRHPLNDKPHPFEDPFPARSFKIMQYTGLKDRNGKELYYNSDVVKIDRDPSGRTWYAVKDDFDIPCFLPTDGAFGVMLTFQDVFLGAIDAKRNGFEIIGNYHEDPDLLPHA